MFGATRYNNHSATVLDNNALARIAPSVFASDRAQRTSERFTFVPTIEVIDTLRNEGWNVVSAKQSNTRDESRQGFQKHMIRFRHQDASLTKVGDSIAEMVLLNAHDGTSSYQFHAGLFRLVCLNGLVVADQTFEKLKIKHSGFRKEDYIDASFKVLSDIPKVAQSVEEMRSIILSKPEQEVFARAALDVRYADPATEAPIDAPKALNPRRTDDTKSDLWTTFNVVQENLLRGGQRGYRTTDINGRRSVQRVTTREVRSVDGNVGLNKALWRLAEEMKALKS